jgi:ribosomal protein S18 acetylase RimI-like enzyme
MKVFRALSDDPDRVRFLPEVLPWVHEAGNPYFDWVFGGPDQARRTLGDWMQRNSSEVSLTRVVLLLEAEAPLGGFISMGGGELLLCRKADTLAVLNEPDKTRKAELSSRLEATRGLFPLVGADQYYLSKVGIAAYARGQGLGRVLTEAYLERGRSAGFTRFRLDVCSENQPALRLYTSLGFRVVSESVSDEAKLRYLALVKE